VDQAFTGASLDWSGFVGPSETRWLIRRLSVVAFPLSSVPSDLTLTFWNGRIGRIRPLISLRLEDGF
jgi:hypothetical protein